MSTTIYLNRKFVPESEATINVYDGGWLHGAGLFETMLAENGRIFRLQAHLERLINSARKILRPIDRSDLPDETIFYDLLERNIMRSARIRVTVTAGSMRSRQNDDEPPELTVCITANKLVPYADSYYEKGVQVVICGYRVSPTDPIAGHKTTAYLPRLMGMREAQQAKCMEALWFTTQNQLAEGSITNVFIVKDGVLKTPPLDTPVLPGIARSVVLELAGEEKIDALECPLIIDDLLDADEVILTNAMMQVMPVIRVEKHDINDSKVGPVAGRLRECYRQLVRKECRL